MNKKEIQEKTRKVYHEQHKKYIEDTTLFSRFLKMTSNPEYYHLTKEDFKGIKILDAGCGNSAYLQVSMYNLGIGHMTCLDLGEEWIPQLKQAIKENGIPDEHIDYVAGNTDKLPFPDDSFDMVTSNGVLIHIYDLKQIKKSFKELARVTKPGGYLYVVMGVSGGLFEEELNPAIRRFYRNNKAFKEIIDNLTPETFVRLFETICQGMKTHTNETFDYTPLKKLFDVDLCTTIQNVLQVPRRHTLEVDKDFILAQFHEHGFETPKRCRRFVVRENIRKYLAPLHYEKDNPLSRILYGDGNLEFIARKKINVV